MFLFHWQEESQHAILDELEWLREDAQARRRRSATPRVDDLIALVGAVDGILQAQAEADAGYFAAIAAHAAFSRRAARAGRRDTVLKAYRWQYIVSGVVRAALPGAPRGAGDAAAAAPHPGRARAADLRDARRRRCRWRPESHSQRRFLDWKST